MAQPDLEVVGVARDGQEALLQARATSPDVIVMDVSMPRMNGLEAMTVLRRCAPKARIIILSMHDNREYIAQATRLGARGYLLKDTSPAELIRAIKEVHAGGAYFSPRVSRLMIEPWVGDPQAGPDPEAKILTLREREVLALIAEGHINKEIAGRLGVGVRTIETHRERIMRKLNVHTVAGLTKYAISRGFVNLD